MTAKVFAESKIMIEARRKEFAQRFRIFDGYSMDRVLGALTRLEIGQGTNAGAMAWDVAAGRQARAGDLLTALGFDVVAYGREEVAGCVAITACGLYVRENGWAARMSVEQCEAKVEALAANRTLNA